MTFCNSAGSGLSIGRDATPGRRSNAAHGIAARAWHDRDRLARLPGVGLIRELEPFGRLGVIAPLLRHPRERSPRPSGELTLAELLRPADRPLQVFLGFVEQTHLAPDDPSFGGGIRQLPPRAEVTECRDRRVK